MGFDEVSNLWGGGGTTEIFNHQFLRGRESMHTEWRGSYMLRGAHLFWFLVLKAVCQFTVCHNPLGKRGPKQS